MTDTADLTAARGTEKHLAGEHVFKGAPPVSLPPYVSDELQAKRLGPHGDEVEPERLLRVLVDQARRRFDRELF